MTITPRQLEAIAQFDVKIADINAQIEALRQQLSHIENEKQNLLAVEQMWESAINQLQSAKAATEAIGQVSLIAEAKVAVDAVFAELPQLPEASEPQPEPTAPTPTSPEPTDNEPPTIDVTATPTAPATPASPSSSATTPASAPSSATKPSTTPAAPSTAKPDYSRLDWAALRRLANRHNITTSRRTRQQIEAELRDKNVAA